jgi:hypothetical protein
MDWLVQHWRGVGLTLAGFLAGGVTGWWAGSFTACASTGCEVRVASIEALGTWLGGLGTIAAVLAAVVAFRSEESARREQIARLARTRREQEGRDEEDANWVKASVSVFSHRIISDVEQVTSFTLVVTNRALASTAQRVLAHSPKWGTFPSARQLGPDETIQKTISLSPDDRSEHLRPFPKPSSAEYDAWRADVLSSITIEFVMNGQRWRRQGEQPAERLD